MINEYEARIVGEADNDIQSVSDTGDEDQRTDEAELTDGAQVNGEAEEVVVDDDDVSKLIAEVLSTMENEDNKSSGEQNSEVNIQSDECKNDGEEAHIQPDANQTDRDGQETGSDSTKKRKLNNSTDNSEDENDEGGEKKHSKNEIVSNQKKNSPHSI
jgi:hypothetical protein